MRKTRLSMLIGLIAVLMIVRIVLAKDLGHLIMPKDANGQKVDTLIGVGANYSISSSTDNVVTSNAIATGPTLIYKIWVASDGSGTDWVKVTTSTQTALITASTTAAYIKTTTNAAEIHVDAPMLITSPYLVVNDTNTIAGVLYR